MAYLIGAYVDRASRVIVCASRHPRLRVGLDLEVFIDLLSHRRKDVIVFLHVAA